MFGLALRNLRRTFGRTVLSLVGMAVAIVLVIGLISFSNGVRVLIEDTLRSVEGLMVVARDAPDPVLSTVPTSAEGRLARLNGVKVVVPEIWWVAITADNMLLFQKGLEGSLVILGVPPERTVELPGGGLYRRAMRAGRFLTPGTVGEVLLPVEVAAKLEKPLGSTIRLPNATLTVVGHFQTDSLILNRTVLVTLEQARAMKKMPPDVVSAYYLELDRPSDRARVATTINARFPGLRAFTPEEANATIGSLLSKLDSLLLVITILPILGAAVTILNTMLMSFSERIREFGILMACGWRRGDVLRLVLTEALLLGFCGGLLGCLVGGSATHVLGHYLSVDPVTPRWLYAACLVLATGIGMAGGAYPAIRAARLAPIEAIRRG